LKRLEQDSDEEDNDQASGLRFHNGQKNDTQERKDIKEENKEPRREVKNLRTYFNPNPERETELGRMRLQTTDLFSPRRMVVKGNQHPLASVMTDRFDFCLMGADENVSRHINQEMKKNSKEIPDTMRKDVFDNPSNFEEAYNHPDPFQREMWRLAIKKEFEKMENHQVLEKIKRSDMNCPEGMNSGRDECLKLKKTIYGLVQSARAFWKKISSVLKDIGF
jgi:hypothetical protein